VFDNSAERDPETGLIPPPRLILHWHNGAIVGPSLADLQQTPDWAKPIVEAAFQLVRLRN
jgi:hypothetical protein